MDLHHQIWASPWLSKQKFWTYNWHNLCIRTIATGDRFVVIKRQTYKFRLIKYISKLAYATNVMTYIILFGIHEPNFNRFSALQQSATRRIYIWNYDLWYWCIRKLAKKNPLNRPTIHIFALLSLPILSYPTASKVNHCLRWKIYHDQFICFLRGEV